jgi:two-component system nitrate/nitrite response regulator NarL
MGTKIRLIIIDDHAMFREGVSRILKEERDFSVVGQFASLTEALNCQQLADVDVALLDVDLGPERALDFVVPARERGFRGRILVVTAGVGEQEAVQLIQAGVAGILHKQNSTEVLRETVRQVMAGEVYLETAYLSSLFKSLDRTRTPQQVKLTERERAVLRYILRGLSNRDITEELGISETAVKASVRHVFEKLHVRTRAQAVRVALQHYKGEI